MDTMELDALSIAALSLPEQERTDGGLPVVVVGYGVGKALAITGGAAGLGAASAIAVNWIARQLQCSR